MPLDNWYGSLFAGCLAWGSKPNARHAQLYHQPRQQFIPHIVVSGDRLAEVAVDEASRPHPAEDDDRVALASGVPTAARLNAD
jgi:hypothetical protein